MDINKLKSIAIKCREAMERSPTNIPDVKFPEGHCGVASNLLASYLCSELGISVEYICGEYGGWNREIYSHAWLEFEGIVLDITSDQFNDKGYSLPPVFVGEKNVWYESFSIDKNSSNRILCQELEYI